MGETNGTSGSDTPQRIRLLELDSDLLRGLSPEARAALARITLPVVHFAEPSSAVDSVLEDGGAFGAIVLDGMLLHYVQVGGQPGLRILGPGELITPHPSIASDVLTGSYWRAPAGTSLALLGNEFLLAARQSQALLVGLNVRLAEQTERLATQLAICQLARVEDRVLAMLWLLADSFGRVTPSGTALPLALTHELLGALVGARRPTVTLALGELTARGSVVHQDRGWLLLEHPPTPEPRRAAFDDPRLLAADASGWLEAPPPLPSPASSLDVLSETVERLRQQHARNLRRMREGLRQSAASYERSAEVRRRLRHRRVRNQPPPSS